MKFEYPIPVSGEDATALLGHKNAVGHYPMGRLFNWHGGLHVFERQYAPIKAIADGVVIAYRVGKTAIECEGVKFSNSFVLLKHKYVSPQGRELPFYSLYNHLMTFDELEAQQKVPDIFAVQKFEVSGKTIKGLFMRKASNFDEKVLVPEGMTVTIDFETTAQSAGATQWAANRKKEQYKKVKYVDPFTKTEYEDYFIFYSSDRFTHVVSDNYKVATSEDSTLKKGENIRELNGSSIKYVVPNGTAVVVDGFVGDKKDYYRVKSLDGEKCDEDLRVWAKSLEGAKEKALCFEEDDCGGIVTGEDCDIAVSAGDIVGFVGLNGFANNENHRSVHVEVFTNEASLSSFLKGVEGDKDDVKDTLNYTKIARGAKLSLKYPLTILKDDEIKVEEFPEGEDEKYCRISLAKVVREVSYYRKSSPSAADTHLSYKAGTEVKEDGEIVSAQYTPAKLKELNLLFYNTLQKDSILDWVASPADDRRKVSFCPPASELTLWTTKAALGTSSKPSAPIKLTSDLQELYYKRPENDEIEFEVEQDVFQKTSELEKIGSDDEQNCWYKVKAVRSKLGADQKRTFSSVEGYIKSDDSGVSKVSAYDWEAFGFEMLDSQADVFVFNNSTEGIKESSAAEFLKAVWKHIDLNGDGELSRPELANALKDRLSQQRLSRLICHHQSEWGVDYEALKSEVEVLLDEGINKEEDEEKKQKLTEKKNKTLASLETKVKSFNFWAEVREPVISLKEKPQTSSTINLPPLEFKFSGADQAVKKPYNSVFPLLKENNIRSLDLPEIPEIEVKYVSLPAQPKFWHFHPIAFVEHMRRKVVNKSVIFPFEIPPQNDRNNSTYNGKEWYGSAESHGATYGALRDGGRKHAGRDLYASWGTPVRAMADGVVIDVSEWSSLQVGVVAIAHKTSDGRSFICRYCELDYGTISVQKGGDVKQGDFIARVGFLKYNGMPPVQTPRGLRTNMLHFEFYSDGVDHAIPGNAAVSVNEYTRSRTDLTDPLEILQEAYDNTFVREKPLQPQRVDIQNLTTSNAGVEFIKLFEGKHMSGTKHIAYDDSENPATAKATIGYGHLVANASLSEVKDPKLNIPLIGVTKSEVLSGIDETRATELLRSDLVTAENGVKRHINVPLSQNEFDALVSLSFNAGADCLGVKGVNDGDTRVKILINLKDYYNGIDEIADITNNGNHGLIKRRQAEMTIFKSNYYATRIP